MFFFFFFLTDFLLLLNCPFSLRLRRASVVLGLGLGSQLITVTRLELPAITPGCQITTTKIGNTRFSQPTTEPVVTAAITPRCRKRLVNRSTTGLALLLSIRAARAPRGRTSNMKRTSQSCSLERLRQRRMDIRHYGSCR